MNQSIKALTAKLLADKTFLNRSVYVPYEAKVALVSQRKDAFGEVEEGHTRGYYVKAPGALQPQWKPDWLLLQTLATLKMLMKHLTT